MRAILKGTKRVREATVERKKSPDRVESLLGVAAGD